MKSLLDGVFTALSLYSVIPAPRTEWNARTLRYTLCFPPLVGLIIAVLSLLWYEAARVLGMAPALYAAVAALLPVVISGGLHMDGFIDSADAIASHGLREQRLKILKDSHVGAFGVLFLGGQLLLSFGLWQQLYVKPRYLAIVAAGYVASRCLCALSIALFPVAKPSGLAHLFSAAAAKRPVVISNFIVLAGMAALALITSLLWGASAIAAALLYYRLHRRWCVWTFGGNTGDLAGFFLTNLELLFLAVAAVGGLIR